MSESFFQSAEFSSLLDFLALLASLLVAPLFWSAFASQSRARRWALAAAYAFFLLSRASAAYQAFGMLLGQLPAPPGAARFVEVFFESAAFWLFISMLLWERRSPAAGPLTWIGGVALAFLGLGAGAGGRQDTALLQAAFHLRPQAEVAFGVLRTALALAAVGGLAGRTRGRERLVYLTFGALLLREASLFALSAGLSPGWHVAAMAYARLSLAAGALGGGFLAGDQHAPGTRTRLWRFLIVGFALFSTVVVALSFNFLLRERLLDETLGRYRSEAEKIGSDIAAYLARLDQQTRALAVPGLFAALAYQAGPAEGLAALPHRFLLEDFRSVAFFTAGGEVLRVYAAEGPGAEVSVLDASGRERLLAAPEGAQAVARNFVSHGPLFYEIDGLTRVRSERPWRQPEIVFAAAVRDAAGRGTGYVEAVFPTNRLQRFFSGYGAEGGWNFVATTGGLLLSHGSPEYAGYDLSSFPELFREKRGARGWNRIELPGGTNYVVTAPVPGRDWTVGRVLSTAAILGALQKLREETLAVIIVTLAVTTLAALLLSGLVNRQQMALERMGLELRHKEAIEAKNVELSLERQKIETILLSIGEGVIVCDAEDRVVFVNEIAERIFGRTAAALRGEPAGALRMLPLEQALRQMRAERDQGITRPDIQEFIAQFQGLDLRGNIAPLVREGESYQGTAIVLQDISEIMKLDRLKTEILSIVSHSLRTPLTSIKSFTEILQEKAGRLEPQKEREYLEIINLSTDRLTRIVNNILDLSKIAGGKMHYNFRPADLTEILREAVTVAGGAVRAKELHLETRWNGAATMVRMDRSKLMQVFDNVLGNAIKFTPHGGTIRVFLEKLEGQEVARRFGRGGLQAEGLYAVARIEDTGMGIAPENLERIFDRFFQEDYVRQSGEGGTGLGLAISREYVQAHGGQVWAQSGRNGGAVFFVALPM